MFHPRLREAFGMCVKKMSVEWTQKKKKNTKHNQTTTTTTTTPISQTSDLMMCQREENPLDHGEKSWQADDESFTSRATRRDAFEAWFAICVTLVFPACYTSKGSERGGGMKWQHRTFSLCVVLMMIRLKPQKPHRTLAFLWNTTSNRTKQKPRAHSHWHRSSNGRWWPTFEVNPFSKKKHSRKSGFPAGGCGVCGRNPTPGSQRGGNLIFYSQTQFKLRRH